MLANLRKESWLKSFLQLIGRGFLQDLFCLCKLVFAPNWSDLHLLIWVGGERGWFG